MGPAGEVLFRVFIMIEKLPHHGFTPHVSIIQQERQTYRSVPLEFEEEIFPSEAAVMHHTKKRIKEMLEKEFPASDILFFIRTSDSEG